MRVGVFFPGISPLAGGGHTVEKDVLESLYELAGQSHHQFILFFNNIASLQPTRGNVDNVRIVILKPAPKMPLITVLLRKVIKALGWNVADTENPLYEAARLEGIEMAWFPASQYGGLLDIPYIATVWDVQHRVQPWFPEVSNAGQWASREGFYSTYLRRAAYIITPNQAGMQELSFFFQIPLERFKLLPHTTPKMHPLPNDEEVKNILQKYKIPKGYLFYPAHFWAHKNHANLLLALQYLRHEHGLSLHLVLTGFDKGNVAYIQNLIGELELHDQVHVLGFVPREDMSALYCGALALTYMSLFGPENLPPLEAFACACPVIASNVAGAQEQFGDAALLVNGLSPQEIALAIKSVHDDPQFRNTLVKKGKARKNFTGLDFVKGIFALLDEFEPVRRNWGSI